jgi:hypothetical protein
MNVLDNSGYTTPDTQDLQKLELCGFVPVTPWSLDLGFIHTAGVNKAGGYSNPARFCNYPLGR